MKCVVCSDDERHIRHSDTGLYNYHPFQAVTDIVTRLRDIGVYDDGSDRNVMIVPRLCNEAADEIVALRIEKRRLRERVKDLQQDNRDLANEVGWLS